MQCELGMAILAATASQPRGQADLASAQLPFSALMSKKACSRKQNADGRTCKDAHNEFQCTE